jgi:hypothetical protein
MKLYIVSYGESGKEVGKGTYCLVAENGECLYSHYCFHRGYAKGDLIDRRPERIAECKKRFGEYEVLFLGEDDMTMEEIVKRNHDWDIKEE